MRITVFTGEKMKIPESCRIHPTAVIEETAIMGEDVHVGPYSIIGPDVAMGDGCRIGPHVVIEGVTNVGRNCRIFQFASVGAAPQDINYKGEKTALNIGNDTIIRESVTIHRGSTKGDGITEIGSRCMIMACCHVAHDCRLGNRVIMANVATLGGHVEIGDHAVIGGLSAIHQFCRIGSYAFLGGMSGANKDIPPFVKYQGQRTNLFGINVLGLKREGFPMETIEALKEAYRIVFTKAATITEGLDQAEEACPDISEVRQFTDFIRQSRRGVPSGEWNNSK